jgi:dTDP-4-amino-4,6-dideoxygalactose transaminase
MTPDAVERALGVVENVRAVMPVAPFGAPVDIAVWEAFHHRTGIPVVVDAAAAFAGQEIGEAPVVISLHATKVLGAGEGAIVLARQPELIVEVTRRLNFGFYGVRTATVAGFNGKMSEYSAAVGLAAFDTWHETRGAWSELMTRYEQALDVSSIQRVRPSNCGVSSTFVRRFDADSRNLSSILADKGIGTIRWYGDGCHAEPGFRALRHGPLPVTISLGSSSLGLPFFLDLDEQSLNRVVSAVAEALARCSVGR